MEGTIKLDGDQVEAIVKSYFERSMFIGDIRVIRVHSPSWHSLAVELEFTDEPAPELAADELVVEGEKF